MRFGQVPGDQRRRRSDRPASQACQPIEIEHLEAEPAGLDPASRPRLHRGGRRLARSRDQQCVEPGQPQGDLHLFQTTTEAPAFFEAAFGARHSGVLAPASHASILAGAEDEGELGAFHHARHAAIRTAILTKLADFLPVGLEAVLVPDARLTEPPHGAV